MLTEGPNSVPDIYTIPLTERIKAVLHVRETIPPTIRIQRLPNGKMNEMWGVITLDSLPFFFRAQSTFSSNKPVDMLSEDQFRGQYKTNWSAHHPYKPLGFTPPFGTPPITEEDMKYMMLGLKANPQDILNAQDAGQLPHMYQTMLPEFASRYERFNTKYALNPHFRQIYSAAVSLVCDDLEKSLKIGTT